MTNKESAPELELDSGLEKIIFNRFLNHRKNWIAEN